MNEQDDSGEIVEIDFEVGHVSMIRTEPTKVHVPPRTHDWTVYLRSAEVSGDLSRLIRRCVFSLHPEFPNSKRELRSTPFAIQESGYAGFHLPIDIYFKTTKEPKKFRIEYDLDLHTNLEGHPQRQKESYVRKYRCTFSNPDPDLREKIVAAGGKVRKNSSTTGNHTETDESDAEEEQVPPPALTEPPKRPFSPLPTVNTTNSKKVKVEQSIINPKKKQPPPPKTDNSSKPTVTSSTIKKVPLPPSNKPVTMAEDKPPKHLPIKDTNGSTDESSIFKSRPLSKIKTEVDAQPGSQLPTVKKKETSVPLKKSLPMSTNKPTQKLSIKTEPTSTTNQSPSTIPIKREPSPNLTSSNSTTSTVLISSLKKIPKKVAPPPPPPPPPVIEKRARSPMTPPPSTKSSDRDSHRYQSSSKRDRPSATTTASSSSAAQNSTSSRSGSGSNRSGKHSTSSSTNRGEEHSIASSSLARSRSRSHSRNRSSHHNHHTIRSHHSSSSSRHPSQQKDRSNRRTSSPHAHQPSKSSSSSSHHHSRRTPTPSKSTRSPQKSSQSHSDPPPLSSSTDLPVPSSVTSSINTPQSRPNSVEPSVAASTTCSPSTHVFHSEDDHTQTPMDIDGQSDDDTNVHRQISLSDEHDQTSPLSPTFVPNDSTKLLTTRAFHSDHSDSLSDTNESNDDSNLSLDDNDDEDLPTVLTDDDLRSKLIYIYNRFTLNSPNDLTKFVTFFKRHQLVDTSSNISNEMFTYDLFSLSPLLIDELATDLGYTTNSILNRTEQ